MEKPFPMAIKAFAGCDANIFWVLEDSSILDDIDPYSTFHNFKSALGNKGYHGPVFIRAYVYEHTLPIEFLTKYEMAGIQIVLVPRGETTHHTNISVLNSIMLTNMLILARSHLNRPSTLVVISEGIDKDSVSNFIQMMDFPIEDYNYNIIASPLQSLVRGGLPKRIPLQNEIVIVICGISGFDKGYVIHLLRKVNKELHFPVTITSSYEEDSLLVQEDEFMRMVEKDELLLYNKDKGVTKNEIHEFMSKGADIVLVVDDLDEALNLHDVLGNSAVFILVHPETDLREKELVRLARKEYKHLDFDYLVVDGEGKLDCTVNRLKSIIKGEKCKVCPRTLKI